MERKVLGRGLEALIPAGSQESKERIQNLKLSEISPSRFQPRVYFGKEKLEELANSIREKGVIQPILVRSTGVDQYELIAGERRFRAAKHLGLEEIPAIIRKIADADALETAIIENIQREELNPVEEAKAYRRLAQEFGITQDAIAKRVGKDKSSVSNLLRLLNLPDKIQDYISQNMITMGHAKALLSLLDPKKQEALCQRIIQKGLSVRQIELLSQRGSMRRAKTVSLNRSSEIRNLEEKLQHVLGTKVRIKHGKKRGSIEIEYYSLEDLDRVLKIIGVKPS